MRSFRAYVDRFLRVRTIVGPVAEVGPYAITPVARSLAVGGRRGTVVRAWPCAVLVSSGGRSSRIPIVDVTRLTQVAIGVSATLWAYRLLTRKD